MPAETSFGVCRGGTATGRRIDSVRASAASAAPAVRAAAARSIHSGVWSVGNAPASGCGSTASRKTSRVSRRAGRCPAGRRRETAIAGTANGTGSAPTSRGGIGGQVAPADDEAFVVEAVPRPVAVEVEPNRPRASARAVRPLDANVSEPPIAGQRVAERGRRAEHDALARARGEREPVGGEVELVRQPVQHVGRGLQQDRRSIRRSGACAANRSRFGLRRCARRHVDRQPVANARSALGGAEVVRACPRKGASAGGARRARAARAASRRRPRAARASRRRRRRRNRASTSAAAPGQHVVRVERRKRRSRCCRACGTRRRAVSRIGARVVRRRAHFAP